MEERFDLPFVSISDQIAIHAQFRGKRPALIEGERCLDWAAYNAVGDRIGCALTQQGIAKGDRVALLVCNGLWAHELLLGIWRAGAVAVPLSPLLTADALSAMLNDSGARVLFASVDYRDLAEEFLGRNDIAIIIDGEPYSKWLADNTGGAGSIELSADDPAVIIYSSGTTGTPKGIVHSHGSRLNFASVFAVQFHFSCHSIALSTIPIHSNGAWLAWSPAKLVGAVTVILPNFSPAGFIDLVKKHRPTHGFIVPTICAQLLEHPGIECAGLECFDAAITAGAPIPTAHKASLQRLTGNGLYELWGLSEGVYTVIDPKNMVVYPTSVGRPIVGCDIRLIDEVGNDVTFTGIGEIVGYSNSMMSGYWKRPEANQALIWRGENGKCFMRTGDIGEFNGQGFLILRGRVKDMIISGGVNVFPVDIESVLQEHDNIKDVSVVGVEHSKWGETPVAFVIADRADGVNPQDIKKWANKRLAKHQRLLDVVLQRGDFPRNTLGKVLKKKLAESYEP